MNGHTIFTPDDQDVFGFAGLWAAAGVDANTVTECCSIITVPANALVSGIRKSGRRMPAMLTRAMRELWLLGTVDSAGGALAAYADERLSAYAVSESHQLAAQQWRTLVEPLETDVD